MKFPFHVQWRMTKMLFWICESGEDTRVLATDESHWPIGGRRESTLADGANRFSAPLHSTPLYSPLLPLFGLDPRSCSLSLLLVVPPSRPHLIAPSLLLSLLSTPCTIHPFDLTHSTASWTRSRTPPPSSSSPPSTMTCSPSSRASEMVSSTEQRSVFPTLSS